MHSHICSIKILIVLCVFEVNSMQIDFAPLQPPAQFEDRPRHTMLLQEPIQQVFCKAQGLAF